MPAQKIRMCQAPEIEVLSHAPASQHVYVELKSDQGSYFRMILFMWFSVLIIRT